MSNNIRENILEIRRQGKKVVGCFPLYPPLELFHSMDLFPVVLWGLRDTINTTIESDKHLQNYTCSIARHLTEFVLSENEKLFDGFFMYNACDTLRNLPEIITTALNSTGRAIPFFNIHIPMVPPDQTDSVNYLKGEISNLIQTLEKNFSAVFSEQKFLGSVELYGKMRDLEKQLEILAGTGKISFLDYSQIIQYGRFMPVVKHIEALELFLNDNADKANKNTGRPGQSGVVLSGILPPPLSVLKAIEAVGLTVVGNDIASLSRSNGATPKPSKDPCHYYVDYYQNHYPCPTLLYTAEHRLKALQDLILERCAKGIIFVGEKFCEYEYFEFPFLEKGLKEVGVSTLLIEIAMDDYRNTAAHKTRIEAFSEMIKQ